MSIIANISKYTSEQADAAQERDVVGFLLLHRIEWTDRHPGLMLVAVGLLIVLSSVLEEVLP
ncbi:hypothetical protein [Massilia aerilata]|uniref:Uncharacterized protein n=1 Tax=Massilia aerilata TaxID=453817 RepID=A0ABW0S5W8_9BURK